MVHGIEGGDQSAAGDLEVAQRRVEVGLRDVVRVVAAVVEGADLIAGALAIQRAADTVWKLGAIAARGGAGDRDEVDGTHQNLPTAAQPAASGPRTGVMASEASPPDSLELPRM